MKLSNAEQSMFLSPPTTLCHSMIAAKTVIHYSISLAHIHFADRCMLIFSLAFSNHFISVHPVDPDPVLV